MNEPLSITDLVAHFEELRLEGKAPSPESFAAAHPEQPQLLGQLRALDRVRQQLQDLVGPERPPVGVPPPSFVPGFTILSDLGEGGMGRVYLARQHQPRRLCAIKLVSVGTTDLRERFAREVNLAARLDHPGICRVYLAGEVEGQPFLVTEYVTGLSLRAALNAADASADRLLTLATLVAPTQVDGDPVRVLVDLCANIADALAHAHTRGVIHRDIKPSNIIIGVDGTAKIIDFGIAVAESTLAGADPGRITATGAFVGSYAYAAPEQLHGDSRALGPWTDTYALGTTLYELLAGRLPFECQDLAERLAIADAPPAQGPRAHNPAVSAELDTLVLRALEPEQTRRIGDAATLATALRRCSTRPSTLPAWPRAALGRLRPDGPWPLLTLVAMLLLTASGLAWRAAADRVEVLDDELWERDLAALYEATTRHLDSRGASVNRCLGTGRGGRLGAELMLSDGRAARVRVLYGAAPGVEGCVAEALGPFAPAGLDRRSSVMMRIDWTPGSAAFDGVP